tara:strand:- start:29 stop:406 length:378 start_codon:yes stop_codon:yes gene_type:complete
MDFGKSSLLSESGLLAGNLDHQALTAFGSTSVDDFSPTRSGHASTKAVAALAFDLTGLVCTLHDGLLLESALEGEKCPDKKGPEYGKFRRPHHLSENPKTVNVEKTSKNDHLRANHPVDNSVNWT